MAHRSEGGVSPWLAFLLGALVVAVAAIGLVVYRGASRPEEPKSLSLNIDLPKAPELPQTPKLPPPPLPIPK